MCCRYLCNIFYTISLLSWSISVIPKLLKRSGINLYLNKRNASEVMPSSLLPLSPFLNFFFDPTVLGWRWGKIFSSFRIICLFVWIYLSGFFVRDRFSWFLSWFKITFIRLFLYLHASHSRHPLWWLWGFHPLSI